MAYRIEKLLSQRKVQKDARTRRSKSRISQNITDKEPKTSKRSRKQQKTYLSPEKVEAVDLEDPIDPRLAQIPHCDGLPAQSPPPFDLVSLHRLRATSGRPCTPPALRHRKISSPEWQIGNRSNKVDSDSEGVVHWPNTSSPAKNTYPDPSALARSLPFANDASLISVTGPPKTRLSQESTTSPVSGNTSETSPGHMIKLKGPQWPGMALFDSASPEAQRLRNQKKEHSILDQMGESSRTLAAFSRCLESIIHLESTMLSYMAFSLGFARCRICLLADSDSSIVHNSFTTQPIERIYFPEWSLKKERPITGNVESSPLLEPSPKPKRRRQKAIRPVLDDLSTNIPRARGRKPSNKAVPENVAERIGFEDPSRQRSFAYNHETGSSMLEFGNCESKSLNDCRLNMGLPNLRNRHSLFPVYRDPPEVEQEQSMPYQFGAGTQTSVKCDFLQLPDVFKATHRTAHGLPQVSRRLPCNIQEGASMTESQNRDKIRGDPNPGVWDHYRRCSRTINASKENIEPLLDARGCIDSKAPRAASPRVTQRYFSITAGHSPSFFESLPAQMEFGGGFMAHQSLGSSLNPLNPLFQQPSLPQGLSFQCGTPTSLDRESRTSCGEYDEEEEGCDLAKLHSTARNTPNLRARSTS